MSIKPNANSYVNITETDLDSINNEAENIIQLLINIDERVLHSDLIDNDKLTKLLFNIRKRIFNLNFKIHELELISSDRDKKFNHLKQKIKFIIENFKLINDFNKQVLQKNKKKAIDTLTVVNTIFLPLSLITGYFGMNFKSMGAPSNKSGIFTLTYGQGFVISLFISLTFFVIFMFYHNIIPQ